MEKDAGNYTKIMDAEMQTEAGFTAKAASFISLILWCHRWMCIVRELYTCFRSLFQILSYIFVLLNICSKIAATVGFVNSVCSKGAYLIFSVLFILWSMLQTWMIKLLLHFEFFFYLLYLQILHEMASGFSSYSKLRRTHGPPPPRVDQKLMVTEQDIVIVMENLGFLVDKKEPFFEMNASVFDENEPSLDEVREAFLVFDKNNDGFIDAEELRIVMYSIGLTAFSSQQCQIMILAFDENGDHRIDLREFLKIMEACSCC